MSVHIWGTSLFSNFFFIGQPLAVFPLWNQVSFISFSLSLSATVQLPECVCVFVEQARQTDTPLQQSVATHWLVVVEYQVACVQQRLDGMLMNPKRELTFPCPVAEGEAGGGCRCPFRSNGPSIHSFNWVSFICLQWPLLFSISPPSFPLLIHFFHAPPLPPSLPPFLPPVLLLQSLLSFFWVSLTAHPSIPCVNPTAYSDFRYHGRHLLFSKRTWREAVRKQCGILWASNQ